MLGRALEEVRVNVLIVGSGVIGTVYGAQLGAAGHAISVLEHGDRTDVIAVRGLHARDVTSGVETHAPVRVVSTAAAPALDVVLVALRRDHLQSAAGALSEISPNALVLFMANNPAGRSGIPGGSGARVVLGLPESVLKCASGHRRSIAAAPIGGQGRDVEDPNHVQDAD
jgi:predicted dinucleotide-binding enzyme